jgi:hypothetical protein
VSVRDITTDSVLLAVRDGYSDLTELADIFEVLPNSWTLRRTVFELADRKAVRIVERCGKPDLIEVQS